MKNLKIVIIGAGPVGLAAAAHAVERGFQPTIIEQGPNVAHAVRQWRHVAMFSNWELNIDNAAKRLLEQLDWIAPCPNDHPTGQQLIDDYLSPLYHHPKIKKTVLLNTKVISIARQDVDKVKNEGRANNAFEVLVKKDDRFESIFADAVIDSSGTWFSPNPAATNGLKTTLERSKNKYIKYSMPDILGHERERYQGRQVAVLGSGHSALGSLIALSQLPNTKISWLIRAASFSHALGGGDADQLVQRGELGKQVNELIRQNRIQVESQFRLSDLHVSNDTLLIRSSTSRPIRVEQLIVATGFRPDLEMLREIRVELDPALECPITLAPLIDPNIHSCGSVRAHGSTELKHPEAQFYIAGMKSYGRAPTFLLATGYEQVRSIVAELDGDIEAARRVELKLPETGVCKGPGFVIEAAQKTESITKSGSVCC